MKKFEKVLKFIPRKAYRVSYSGSDKDIPSRLLCVNRLSRCVTFIDAEQNQYTFPFVNGQTFDQLSNLSDYTHQEIAISSSSTRIFAESWFEHNPKDLNQIINDIK